MSTSSSSSSGRVEAQSVLAKTARHGPSSRTYEYSSSSSSSSSRASAQQPAMPCGSFRLAFGQSFLSVRGNKDSSSGNDKNSNSKTVQQFHTIKFDVKPPLSDRGDAVLSFLNNDAVKVTVPPDPNGGHGISYRGTVNQTKPGRECVLILDPETQTLRIERVTCQMAVKHVRSENDEEALNIEKNLPAPEPPHTNYAKLTAAMQRPKYGKSNGSSFGGSRSSSSSSFNKSRFASNGPSKTPAPSVLPARALGGSSRSQVPSRVSSPLSKPVTVTGTGTSTPPARVSTAPPQKAKPDKLVTTKKVASLSGLSPSSMARARQQRKSPPTLPKPAAVEILSSIAALEGDHPPLAPTAPAKRPAAAPQKPATPPPPPSKRPASPQKPATPPPPPKRSSTPLNAIQTADDFDSDSSESSDDEEQLLRELESAKLGPGKVDPSVESKAIVPVPEAAVKPIVEAKVPEFKPVVPVAVPQTKPFLEDLAMSSSSESDSDSSDDDDAASALAAELSRSETTAAGAVTAPKPLRSVLSTDLQLSESDDEDF